MIIQTLRFVINAKEHLRKTRKTTNINNNNNKKNSRKKNSKLNSIDLIPYYKKGILFVFA